MEPEQQPIQRRTGGRFASIFLLAFRVSRSLLLSLLPSSKRVREFQSPTPTPGAMVPLKQYNGIDDRTLKESRERGSALAKQDAAARVEREREEREKAEQVKVLLG